MRIFSLAHHRIQATLHFPIATNHASISPDGRHLVVVGDSTQVYFYHSDNGSSSGTQREAGREPWTPSSQSPLTAGTENALISTSFSPSSILCAVASQDGSITVFNTRYLSSTTPHSLSPVVKTIRTSRSRTYAGAVRSVQFSPAPWDLLIWSEHSGKVSVADTRSNFFKQQTLDVLADAHNIREIDVYGISEDEVCGSGRRRLTREDGKYDDYLDDEPEGFSPVERESWHSSHSATSLYSPPVEATSTVAYIYPPYHMRNIPAASISSITLNHYSASPEAMSNETGILTTNGRSLSPNSSNLREYRERQLERDRARQRIHDTPRRRGTIYPSAFPAIERLPSAIDAAQLRDGSAVSPIATTTNTTTITTTTTPPATTTNPSRPPVHWRIDYEAQRRPTEEVDQLRRNREMLNFMIAEERRRNYLRRAGRNAIVDESVADDHHHAMEAYLARYAGSVGEMVGIGGQGVDITGCTMSSDGSKL